MDQFWYDRHVEPEGKPDKFRVFDTTLRDGEQTPGVTLTAKEKSQIAQALSDLGVDYIEAGFPISSHGEKEAVEAISEMGLKSEVVGLARCVEKDLDAAIDAGVDLVHVFIGTSPVHREYKLKLSKEQVIDQARDSIQYVKDRGGRIHFSPEDACRTELEYLKEVVAMAKDAGAEHVNIPDTVGVMSPEAMAWLIRELKKTVDVEYAVHCHNDFGLASANTVAAITSGATIAHVTVNGLGERAGNASLEQVVMAAKMIHGIESNIDAKKIWKTSRLVEQVTNVKVMPNYPIVGGNAFAHESGVHVHGILAKAQTYEAIEPEAVGTTRRMVLGKHVGKAGVKDRLTALGYEVADEVAQKVTDKVKDLADKGKKVTEDDLAAIAEDMLGQARADKFVVLEELELHAVYGKNPKAKVKLTVKGQVKTAQAEGVGPVDAALTAIREGVGEEIELDEYHLDAITGGSDALADVTIRVSRNGNSKMAQGVHEDVVMASVTAFVNGVNRIMRD